VHPGAHATQEAATVRIEATPAGLRVEADSYSLSIPAGSPYARLEDRDGERWADLLLDASLDSSEGLDETTAREAPVLEQADGWFRVTIRLASSRWAAKELRLEGDAVGLRLTIHVEGQGRLTDVHLLGGRSSALPSRGTGFQCSGAGFRAILSPGPSDPARLVRSAAEPASLDVSAGSGPGRGNWFFTPPPFCFAVSRSAARADGGVPAGPWLAMGISGPIQEATFGAVAFEPGERSFSIRLEYEGQTALDREFETPSLVLLPGFPDPYAAIGAWADDLRKRGWAPAARPGPAPGSRPGWWLAPIFCGWGAQAAMVRDRGGVPADHATQAAYDGFLAALAEEDLAPGTVVIDDRWQRHYGEGAPDRERWPDLAGWIRGRHDRGQKVLLWWKCWDPDGIRSSLCVRNGSDVAVTVDPSNHIYEDLLRGEIRRMLGSPAETGDPHALDADGLKVDFSGLTPSGPSLRRHGRAWGVALLHRLLEIIHDEAHRTKHDALVITHAPHPAFADVTDMVRLNDLLRLGEPEDDRSTVVEQMRHRGRIVAASVPGMPIDTDDWCAPDLALWRRYQAVKLDLGVPSLYYATTLDLTGERLQREDYALLRTLWRDSRAKAGLPECQAAREAV
jgi:hypothetical protein